MTSQKLSRVKSRSLFPNKGYDVFYLLICVVLLIHSFSVLYHKIVQGAGTAVVDNLYNFAGGFVRRGLGGEIVFFLQDSLGIPIAVPIYLSSLVAYSFLAWISISYFRKKGYGINVLIMGFALGGVLVHGFDSYRRDFVELAFLAVTLLSFTRLTVAKWLVLGNLITMFGIALHEATFFFTVPVLIMIANLRIRNIWKSLCAWVPSIIVFAVCCICKGSPDMVSPIIGRAMEYAPECFPGGEVPWLLKFIGFDTETVVKMHLNINFFDIGVLKGFPVPAFLITLVYFVYIPYCMVAMLIAFTPGGLRNGERNRLVRIVVFQFICLIPMFTVLSCDLARVSCYWIMSSLLVWLIIDRNDQIGLFRSGYDRLMDMVSTKLFSKWIPGRMSLTILMLVIGVTYVTRNPRSVLKSSIGYDLVTIFEETFDSILTVI